MIDKEIIDNYYNLSIKKIQEFDLKSEADKVKSDPFFIGEKAKDKKFDFNITRDVDFIQADLIYTTGILFALRPFINNPISESKFFMGKQRATYFQNMYDSLYSMYASICFEKLYNFWDRIGDKIASEFPKKFENPRAIMFANVIEKIKNEKLENSNLDWLISFKENEFKDFNDKRKNIVHYEQLETKYMESILDNFDNMETIEKIFDEKFTLPDFFKEHIQLTNLGIKVTYDFAKSNR